MLPFVLKYIGLKIWVINDKEYHLTIICKITIFLISFRESSFFSLVSDAKLFYLDIANMTLVFKKLYQSMTEKLDQVKILVCPVFVI